MLNIVLMVLGIWYGWGVIETIRAINRNGHCTIGCDVKFCPGCCSIAIIFWPFVYLIHDAPWAQRG